MIFQKSNRLQAEDLECTITNYKDRGPGKQVSIASMIYSMAL